MRCQDKGKTFIRKKTADGRPDIIKGIDINGKTNYGSGYANTCREVKAKLQLKRQNLTPGFVSVKEYYTFRETACLWLKDSQIRLKGASLHRHENLLNMHILPDFGN